MYLCIRRQTDMYFVVNLCLEEVVAECLTYAQASIALVDAIQDCGGFYTEDDFAIADEDELDNYY